jgi:hypothetical protein
MPVSTRCAYGVFSCAECGRQWADELYSVPPELLRSMDAAVADHFGCEASDVERFSSETLSGAYVALCDAPTDEYWPTCCDRPAGLVAPLVALEV